MPPDPVPVTATDIVVGIPTYHGGHGIGQALETIGAACRRLGGGATCVIVHAEADGADAASATDRAADVPVVRVRYRLAGADRLAGPWLGVPAKGSAVRTIFAEAQRLGAAACVIVDRDLDGLSDGWLAALADPVLQRDIDFVAPYYARHKFAGVINTGVAYPLVRTLYGKRIRFPIGGDFACSRRFAERSLAEAPWDSDVVNSMPDLWLATRALASGARVGQAMLGTRRQVWTEPGGDAAAPLAKVLTVLFTGVAKWQAAWQKVRGSEPVSLSGSLNGAIDAPVDVDPREGMEAFRLAHQHLDEVWRIVLPPGTLLDLKKLAQADDAHFRMADATWARCLYDFSLAFHQRRLGREHVVNAFAPLFSAWVSSIVAETRDATPAAFEERIDHLCLRFEGEKPYLISRWRWPDRFSP